ncbi:MAG TPA: primosomal protein N' [Solirubrobacterales bacterium]|jgi:primosomal protein N' (replication factor Y)|nr:primosomal protein N' [Solirubrobacterales bacterium]
MDIAKVEPMTTTRALRGPFDYRLPEPMVEAGVGVGSLLMIPFGGRRMLGVVVGVAAESDLPPERLAEPLEAIEAGATPELVRLGLWVADRYCSTPPRGLALVLPPGSGTGRKPKPMRALTERTAALTPDGAAALDPAREGPRLGARQRAVLERLDADGELSGPRIRELTGADSVVLARLAERGLIERRTREVRRAPRIDTVGAVAAAPRLSPRQAACAAEIVAALAGDGERERLLHGVTGSGKTEVYLAAIEAALEHGRSAILLVPEIGLTPQTVGRVAARLGDTVAVLHSGLSEGERFDEWRRLRSGVARVCVGPRSAVFAPLTDLGLIVVDEEHDPSYKQEGDPRYDARAVARRRAADTGAVYLAGSATPRPESWAELDRLQLPERIDGRPLPPVEILDMREVPGAAGPLHPRTREALAGLGDGGSKAIVMLNRRGFSPHLSCGSCGAAVSCPNCDVSLVLHRGNAVVGCHHCGHTEPVPKSCPQCGSVSIARHGAGTERIEQLVGELIAPASVFRLDADTVAGRGGHARVLTDFERADGGVLVGTQMVAKGHDFPDVSLSVLIDADSTLRYPDFRAEERTFALVAQLAGRSGRGERGGRVLVQTLAPDADPIAAAASHDAAGFLAGELERRREFGYPPFSSLLAVELTAPAEAALVTAGERIAAALRPALGPDAELLGPAPRFRRRGRFRRRLLIKSAAPERDVAAVREALELPGVQEVLRGITLAVDVDPQ